MKVYLVGDRGPEHNDVRFVCKTYSKALEKFQEIRKQLIEKVWSLYPAEADDPYKDTRDNELEKLAEADPKKIDNYPQETPYIREMRLI